MSRNWKMEQNLYFKIKIIMENIIKYREIKNALNNGMKIAWMYELNEFRIKEFNWLDFFCYNPLTNKINSDWNIMLWNEIHMPLNIIYEKALNYNKIEAKELDCGCCWMPFQTWEWYKNQGQDSWYWICSECQ